eukprot:TRINITY_DN36642_c0_g1_i1.p1 TRINITY_DN36642_c0_g1~~TRINITY_DN36642_c0_g1_i1.p1  ORF type:complete len:259 (+),score=50.09 TRINITY_DN36642_c0_g1_i1:76-852(+)
MQQRDVMDMTLTCKLAGTGCPCVGPHRHNELGQPIGFVKSGWTGCPFPKAVALEGRCARLEPTDVEKHAEDLFATLSEDKEGRMWTYMRYGPFATFAEYRDFLTEFIKPAALSVFTVINKETGKACGIMTYLHIIEQAGVLEIGNIALAPCLQRTIVATESFFLLMEHAFKGLGYRRVEWRCDSLNDKSRAAALRLGFTYEGTLRHAVVYKDRNRNTAMFSLLDSEWEDSKRAAMVSWLEPQNFDDEGRQKKPLGAFQ